MPNTPIDSSRIRPTSLSRTMAGHRSSRDQAPNASKPPVIVRSRLLAYHDKRINDLRKGPFGRRLSAYHLANVLKLKNTCPVLSVLLICEIGKYGESRRRENGRPGRLPVSLGQTPQLFVIDLRVHRIVLILKLLLVFANRSSSQTFGAVSQEKESDIGIPDMVFKVWHTLCD